MRLLLLAMCSIDMYAQREQDASGTFAASTAYMNHACMMTLIHRYALPSCVYAPARVLNVLRTTMAHALVVFAQGLAELRMVNLVHLIEPDDEHWSKSVIWATASPPPPQCSWPSPHVATRTSPSQAMCYGALS